MDLRSAVFSHQMRILYMGFDRQLLDGYALVLVAGTLPNNRPDRDAITILFRPSSPTLGALRRSVESPCLGLSHGHSPRNMGK